MYNGNAHVNLNMCRLHLFCNATPCQIAWHATFCTSSQGQTLLRLPFSSSKNMMTRQFPWGVPQKFKQKNIHVDASFSWYLMVKPWLSHVFLIVFCMFEPWPLKIPHENSRVFRLINELLQLLAAIIMLHHIAQILATRDDGRRLFGV